MKNSLSTLLLSILFLVSYSQELRYDVHGRYIRPVTKEKISEAKLIGDFIIGYPVNWTSDYVSVEIMTTCNGKAMKSVSKNDILTIEQKRILNMADLAADIVINAEHWYKNPATDKIEKRKINISATVIPDVEAEYIGGYPKLAKYLWENAIYKISTSIIPEWLRSPKDFQQGVVLFTVNEEGDVTNAKISESTGEAETDKLLLDTINKMPRWKPAEDANGMRVKQEFEFTVGNGGC